MRRFNLGRWIRQSFQQNRSQQKRQHRRSMSPCHSSSGAEVLEARALLAAVVGDEAFLQGNFVEVGIHASGSFGTEADAPEGYHPFPEFGELGVGNLGFVADYDRSGWDSATVPGNPNQTGDFFVPGTPEESFTVEWGNGETEHTFTNAGLVGDFDIPQTSISDNAQGTIDSAVWTGTATAGAESLDVTQTVTVGENDLYFVVSISLTNRSSTTLSDVEYMRSVDPDQEEPITNDYSTFNSVYDVGPSQVLVMAEGSEYGLTGGFGANTNSADLVVVSTEGFINRDPDEILDSPIQPPQSAPQYEDEAIAIAFRFNELAPGQSVTFNFVVILDASDLDEALNSITAVEIVQPTGTVSGNAVSFQATTNDIPNTTQVEFFVGGTSIGIDTTPDLGGIFETTFDSFPFPDGSLSIRAEATFADTSTSSRTETVIVSNFGPEISFITPLNGSEFPIGGTSIPVSISVDNLENPPVVVNFFRETVGGSVSLGSDTTEPFGTTFSVADLPPGSNVTIKAVAQDSAGRLTTITVNGAVAEVAPDVLIDDVTVNEGDTASFTVSLTNASSSDITLTIGTTDGSAASPGDYSGPSAQVTIPAGDLSATATFDVSTVAGPSYELTEDFTVGVVSVDAGAVGDTSDTGTGTILDLDEPPVAYILSNEGSTVTEGGLATFDVVLDHASFEDITVYVRVSDGSAVAPDDYDGGVFPVTIEAGETSVPFTVQTIQDPTDEPDENFYVSLDAGDIEAFGYGGGVEGIIIDDDDPPTVSVNDSSATEGGAVTFTVSLSAASSYTIVVDFETSDDTATAGSDYTANSGSVTFNPGETSKTVEVETSSDDVDEPNESFLIDLLFASNASIGDGQGLGTILDDNPTPSVIIGDASGDEGTQISFNVSLSGKSSQDTVLTLGTISGTAISPDDYTGPNATITIPAGSTSATATFDVDLLTDDQSETDENFTVHVVSVDSGNVIATDTGLGTIYNVSSAFIIDDGDPGYSTTGSWTRYSGAGKGHLNDFELATAKGTPDVATWTFDLDRPGKYLVSVSYRAWSNRATNAPYTVFDTGSNLGTVPIDQTVPANDVQDSGTWFETLGTYNIYGSQLIVTLGDQANNFVSADAVRVQYVEALPGGPEILVEHDSVSIVDNTGVLDLGDILRYTTDIRTITVSNTGTSDLTLTEPISLPAGVSLVSSFGSLTVAPGSSTTFEIQLDTSALGPIGGEVQFSSNDADEEPYNFMIQAVVQPFTQIIDNSSAVGFSTTGTWPVVNRNGFDGGFQFTNKGDGSSVARWVFDIPLGGDYRVSATYFAWTNRVTDAQYTVLDEATPLATVAINQQNGPNDLLDQGVWFEDLGTFTVVGSQLVIELSNFSANVNPAEYLVVADAIRIERL
jgi:hypothetical protein